MLVQFLIICNVKVNVSCLKSTSLLLPSSKQKVIVFKTGLFVFYKELFLLRKIFHNQGVYPTKLCKIGCLTPFITDPSITSHFKCNLHLVLYFKILSLV